MADSDYRVTRLFLAPEYRDLSPAQVEALLEATFPGIDADAAEDLFRGVGRAFQGFGQTLSERAPGIISGAVQGATTGAALGPWGILGGAALGGVTGGLQAPQRGSGAAPGASAPRPSPQPMPAGPAPSSGEPNPSVQLMSLLGQPQVAQALLASVFGRAGRQTLPAGNATVPTSAVLQAVGNLATRAAEEIGALEYRQASAAYLTDAAGEYAVDPADPDARAARVVRFLADANDASWTGGQFDESDYGDDYEYDEFDEYDESDFD